MTRLINVLNALIQDDLDTASSIFSEHLSQRVSESTRIVNKADRRGELRENNRAEPEAQAFPPVGAEPDYVEDYVEKLVQDGLAIKAFTMDLDIDDPDAADTLTGYYLYDGWEDDDIRKAKSRKIVATGIVPSGSYGWGGGPDAWMYPRKVTGKQAQRWYVAQFDAGDDY